MPGEILFGRSMRQTEFASSKAQFSPLHTQRESKQLFETNDTTFNILKLPHSS